MMDAEDLQLHDVPITVSRSYKQHNKLICYNCKTRRSKRIFKAIVEETKGSLSILDLPDVILINIISRLPIKSIFHSKCVCKEWYNLISEPYFANIHLANSPFVSMLNSSYNDALSYLLEVEAEYKYIVSPSEAIHLGNKFSLPKWFKNEGKVIGSCNGLLCLLHGNAYNDDHRLYMSNPMLRECVAIPKPSLKRVHHFVYGFGYSAATGQFKILRIAETEYIGQPSKSEAQIFTIGVDKSWRGVGACPFPNGSTICRFTLNGALHWIEANYPIDDVHLFSFDLAEEKVRALPSPHGLSGLLFMEVGVLGNCLCIFDYNWMHQVDIWWMRDYGVGESWTRDRILKSWIGMDIDIRLSLQPITIWRDGKIVMVSQNGSMFFYDPQHKKSTKVNVLHNGSMSSDDWKQKKPIKVNVLHNGSMFSYGPKQKKSTKKVKVSCMKDDLCVAIPYVPSFSSLKAVMGENVKMIDINSRS